MFEDYWELAEEASNGLPLESVKERWRLLVKKQLADWRIEGEGVSMIGRWGEEGHNWDSLHIDDSKSSTDYFDLFWAEVKYYSDRMNSLDRLLRCNWLLNAAIYKLSLE